MLTRKKLVQWRKFHNNIRRQYARTPIPKWKKGLSVAEKMAEIDSLILGGAGGDYLEGRLRSFRISL